MSDAPAFDPSSFINDPYVKKNEKPWGYELHFADANTPYLSKLMHINAGCRQSLQIHDQKRETFVLIKGEAYVSWENNKGELIKTPLVPYQGYTTLVGQKHRICAVTDCDVMESSTPEKGTTWRLEDDYARPNETPDQRKLERGEV